MEVAGLVRTNGVKQMQGVPPRVDDTEDLFVLDKPLAERDVVHLAEVFDLHPLEALIESGVISRDLSNIS